MSGVSVGRWYVGVRVGPANLFLAWFNATTWRNYGEKALGLDAAALRNRERP